MALKIECGCGREVTTNTWLNHVKSSKCELPDKTFYLEVLSLVKKHKRGWLKTLKGEAVADRQWFIKVLNGVNSTEDFVFDPPRPLGQIRKSSAKISSELRKGSKNPSVKSKSFNFTVEQVKERAKQLYQTGATARSVLKILKAEFKDFRFLISDQGLKKAVDIVSWLTGVSVQQLKAEGIKYRGIRIAIGQQASPTMKEVRSRNAATLFSKWKISRPHLELYQMILSVDPEAKMEQKLKGTHKWFSYDIYSPKLNAMIEMHGAFWHTVPGPKTKGRVLKMIKHNLVNDVFKAETAIEQGFRLEIFWDKDSLQWEERIKALYDKQPISYKEAQDKVGQAIGYPARLRSDRTKKL
jgi:G:T-mismatch repair DNA endonuclease (very short patch repair protein)